LGKGARAALALLEALGNDGKLATAQQEWPQLLRAALAQLPRRRPSRDDRCGSPVASWPVADKPNVTCHVCYRVKSGRKKGACFMVYF
jgi:hypothetical protein